jgi:predicted SnoaL-like aldol condensation-catalyzing enzyme
MNIDLEHNKRIVLEFYETAFNAAQPAEAMRKHGGSRYTQHNPEVADGVEGFVAFATRFSQAYPLKRLEIRRVIAEGDLVALHVFARTSPEDRGAAIVDIFRVEQGKIVEHWDVIQPIPAVSANDNGMF